MECTKFTLTLLQDDASIRETSLIGNSSLTTISNKNSSILSVLTLSPGLNGETSSELLSPFTENWFVSSLLCLISMPPLAGQSIEDTTLSRLRDCNTVREDRLLMEFWPRIGNGMFNVGNTKGMREKNLIYGGMLVTRIARLLGLLTNEWRSALSVEPQPHVFKKKSLIAIGVIMELHDGMCVWPGNMAVEEEDDKGDDEGDEGAGGDAG
ncbi:hypothetical protein Tco_0721761 [Tanacetum coccineum]